LLRERGERLGLSGVVTNGPLGHGYERWLRPFCPHETSRTCSVYGADEHRRRVHVRCWPTETHALLKENQRQRGLAGQVSVAPSLLRGQLLPHYEQHVNAKHVWRYACLNEQTYITPAHFTKVATSEHKHRHKVAATSTRRHLLRTHHQEQQPNTLQR